jgi:hypothetical protein
MLVWVMTAERWERVESGRGRLRDASYAGTDPDGQLQRAIFGDEPLSEGDVDRAALVFWALTVAAFLGEWVPRRATDGVLQAHSRAFGLSRAEAAVCFDQVLEIVEHVATAQPGDHA